jgi:DNA-directed RNA polymerase delta subunit
MAAPSASVVDVASVEPTALEVWSATHEHEQREVQAHEARLRASIAFMTATAPRQAKFRQILKDAFDALPAEGAAEARKEEPLADDEMAADDDSDYEPPPTQGGDDVEEDSDDEDDDEDDAAGGAAPTA